MRFPGRLRGSQEHLIPRYTCRFLTGQTPNRLQHLIEQLSIQPPEGDRRLGGKGREAESSHPTVLSSYRSVILIYRLIILLHYRIIVLSYYHLILSYYPLIVSSVSSVFSRRNKREKAALSCRIIVSSSYRIIVL